MKCPSHIEPFAQDASSRFTDADDYHHYYQVQCSCGGRWFQVWKADKPAIAAQCKNCGKKITVYDVSFYPAACAPATNERVIMRQNCSAVEGLKRFLGLAKRAMYQAEIIPGLNLLGVKLNSLGHGLGGVLKRFRLGQRQAQLEKGVRRTGFQ